MLMSVQMRASCFKLFCVVARPPFIPPVKLAADTAAPWIVPLLLTLLGAIAFPLTMFARAAAAVAAPVPPALTGTVLKPLIDVPLLV
jgi:hypothetical protein